MSARRRVTLRGLAFCAGLALCAMAPAGRAAPQSEALSGLAQALGTLEASDLGRAQSLLDAYRAEVGRIRTVLDGYAGDLTGAIATCDRALQEMEVLKGQITRSQESAQALIADAERRLKDATETEAVAEADLVAAETALAAVKRQLAEHRRKVHELETWWWVPFYGAYLGIRELVDKDSVRIGDLERTIGHLRREDVDAKTRKQAQQQIRDHYLATLSRSRVELELFAATTGEMAGRIGRLRDQDAALHDTTLRLEPITRLIDQSVAIEADVFEVFLDEARGALGTAMDAEDQVALGLDPDVTASFAAALDRLVAQIDQGLARAQLHQWDCANSGLDGAPEAPACAPPRFSYFHRAPDGLCRFTYDNPPDCPPALTAGPVIPPTRAMPTRADTNLIGAARCVSDEALFLGKAPNAETCRIKCAMLAECTYFSWYEDDRWVPGAASECWGGTRHLDPDHKAQNWPGVISGGLPCAFDSSPC